MPKQVLKKFQLLEGGSEILGTTAYWSDMDILCVLPKYISIYDFIAEDEFGLYGALMTVEDLENINTVKSSRIFIIEFKMYGIDVDLIYAQIPFEKIETDFDIMDNEIIQWNKDKRSILALADCLSYMWKEKA
uniref:Polymerase nucleotidyl transferase domain-containing protein n=1 Tax=Meloidogyne incognita TaxID=6306 RepID=A0A914KIN6_MELIC